MANGRFADYYWNVFTVLAENADIVSHDEPAFFISNAFDAEMKGSISARIPFGDGSVLHARCFLEDNGEVVERDYAYVYLNANGERVFQYDDNEHHPGIQTSPHHMHKGVRPTTGADRAWPLDVPVVNFESVFQRIRERFFA